MIGWEGLRDLALDVTAVQIEELRMAPSPNWTRRTRLIQFSGPDSIGGELHGAGEDVSWVEVSPDEIFALYPEDLLCHQGSFAEWSQRLDAREATPAYLSLASARRSEPDYLRWALESAAMELALRQNRVSLASLLAREPRSMRFCLSMGLGEPPTTETLRAWLQHGDYQFKLDASSLWNDALIAELERLDCVTVVDLKAYYHDTPVDQPVDPALYARVASGMSSAVIEDALPNHETLATLRAHADRLSWDAPIHSHEDVSRVVPSELGMPRWMNIRPSRFGTWRRLFAMYDWAHQNQVRCYGGGQFELGIGREHAQALACLFHPEGANDLAPAVFHTAEPGPGFPVHALAPQELKQTVWLAADDTPR